MGKTCRFKSGWRGGSQGLRKLCQLRCSASRAAYVGCRTAAFAVMFGSCRLVSCIAASRTACTAPTLPVPPKLKLIAPWWWWHTAPPGRGCATKTCREAAQVLRPELILCRYCLYCRSGIRGTALTPGPLNLQWTGCAWMRTPWQPWLWWPPRRPLAKPLYPSSCSPPGLLQPQCRCGPR